MNTKSLGSRQVRLTYKLSCYHSQIDYYQDKANIAANTLSKFFQKSQNKKNKLQAENSQILHYLQNLLTNTSLAGLSFLSSLPSYLHQIFIYGTYILPQLRQFWKLLCNKLINKKSYQASADSMRLRLQKL